MGLIIETAGCHMVHPASVYNSFFKCLIYKSLEFSQFEEEFDKNAISVETAEKTVVLLKKYKSKLKLSDTMHVQMCEAWIKIMNYSVKNKSKITIK